MKKEFQIKEPCNVGRENMKEISGGSFCDLCSKKVHDLSHKSDEEIKILLDTNESICGRIQVSRLYQQEEIAKTTSSTFLSGNWRVGFFLQRCFLQVLMLKD